MVACPYEAKIIEEISERRKELKPSCVTPVEEGMEIITDREEIEKSEPKRIVSSFQGHAVGGVGTPYWLKPRSISCGFITNGRLLNIL